MECGKKSEAPVCAIDRYKSCGCLKTTKLRKISTTHGKSNTKEYQAYRGMITRCYVPSARMYYAYGGRGIKVCERWLDKENGFLNFLSDMGLSPTKEHQLDKIDNNKDYSPENCRWVTFDIQKINKRSVHLITHNGETMCATDWGRRLGKSLKCIMGRVKRGLSLDEVLTDKVYKNRYTKIFITMNEETLSISQWSKRLNIPIGTIRDRYNKGLTAEEILNTKYQKHGK